MTATELPDPDQLRVPDLPEAIVAWRHWDVDGAGRLISPMFARAWPVGRPLEAHCQVGFVGIAGAGQPSAWPLVANGARSSEIRYRSHRSPSIMFGPSRGPGLASGPGPGPRPRVAVHETPCSPRQVAHHDGHGCGIYGVLNPEQITARFGRNGQTVVGEVWLSGQVLEYSDGYRASRATPKALWRSKDPAQQALIELAAERYDIPIVDPVTQIPLATVGISFAQHVVAGMSPVITAAQWKGAQTSIQFLASLKLFTGPTAADQRQARRRRRRWLAHWCLFTVLNAFFAVHPTVPVLRPLSLAAAVIAGYRAVEELRKVRKLTAWLRDHAAIWDDDEDEEDEEDDG